MPVLEYRPVGGQRVEIEDTGVDIHQESIDGQDVEHLVHLPRSRAIEVARAILRTYGAEEDEEQ